MGTLHQLPDRDQRSWQVLWSMYRDALRQAYAWVPDPEMDEHLERCEAFVRPFFEALMTPVQLQAEGIDPGRLATLPPAEAQLVAEDVDRFLRELLQAWAVAQGAQIRKALIHLAAGYLAERLAHR